MRLLLATAVLLVGILIGFASSSGTSAQGRNLQAGIAFGEKLGLWFDTDKQRYDCTVMEVRGDFVGCQADSQRMAATGVESWYNLRLVAKIERPAKQQ